MEMKTSQADYSIPRMQIIVKADPDPFALIVKTTDKQDNWFPDANFGKSDKVLRPSLPPTTFIYENKEYRLVEEVTTTTGWEYRMKEHSAGEAMHGIVHLTAEKIIKERTEKIELKRLKIMTELGAGYEILLGWLPGEMQEALSDRWHFSPVEATRKNAFLQILICMVIAVLFLAMLNIGAAFILVCLAVEGIARWMHAWGYEEPCGLTVLELGWKMYRRLTRKRSMRKHNTKQ